MKCIGDFENRLSTGSKVCSLTGCVLTNTHKTNWLAWAFSGMGLLSLIWFLVRVIPKPSRAAYPCQRAAFPIASGFVVWMMALLWSAFAWRKSRWYQTRFWPACLWSATAVALAAAVVTNLPTFRAFAGNPPHGPLGVAKGIFPGRVAWVHAPTATSWAGEASAERWFQTNHTDFAVVTEMMSKAVRSVGGGDSDAAAWEGIFRYRPMHLTLVTQRLVASLPLNTPPVGAICRPQESTG